MPHPTPCRPCSARLFLPLALTVFVLSGCGGTGSGGGAGTDPGKVVPDRWPAADGSLTTTREGCDVLDGPARPAGSFVVAVTETIDPAHAPVPGNRAERIVFAQLYETLVRVGCDGRVEPGLAVQWACTEDSTTWVFTLREGARFWDGSRITAEDVRSAWTANAHDAGAGGGASPWSWISAGASSITAVDARRLAIQLPEPHARFPLLLAHPAAAVAVRRDGWLWPVGSGPARLRASDPAPRPDLTCLPNLHHPHGAIWKSLTFHVSPGADPRDLVVAAPDLMLVRDLETVAFFAEAPGFGITPLPWDRLYLLVCPPGPDREPADRWAAAVARLEVERDVTGISARAWDQVTFPVGGESACPQLSGPITGAHAAPLDSELARRQLDALTIVYPQGDTGGAELAGRLSHLAGAQVRIAGLGATDLELALQWQMAGAFVLAQDQAFPTGCLQLATLLGRAGWLQEAALARPVGIPAETLPEADRLAAWPRRTPAANLARAGIVRPLALGRRWLVTHGELAGLRLDFDGTPRLEGLGRPDLTEANP